MATFAEQKKQREEARKQLKPMPVPSERLGIRRFGTQDVMLREQESGLNPNVAVAGPIPVVTGAQDRAARQEFARVSGQSPTRQETLPGLQRGFEGADVVARPVEVEAQPQTQISTPSGIRAVPAEAGAPALPAVAAPGRQTSFTQADARGFEVPEGSFAGTAGEGSLTTVPAFNPEDLAQQTRIAMLRKRGTFAPGMEGAEFGSEEEALRAGPGFTRVGQTGGAGLFGTEATEARNQAQSINNQYDLAIARAKNSLTGRAKGRAVEALEKERSAQLGLGQTISSEERIARIAADTRGGINPLEVARLGQRQREFEEAPARAEQEALRDQRLGIQRDEARIGAEQAGRARTETAEALRTREDEIFSLTADPAVARSTYRDLAGRPGITQEVALSIVDSVLKENPELAGGSLQEAINQQVANYLSTRGVI